MSNRILIGERYAGNLGAWVSNPGFDVLTADAQDLSFDMNRVPFRVLQKGQFNHVANQDFNYTYRVTFPSIGYPPIILGHMINTSDPTYWLDDAQFSFDQIQESSFLLKMWSFGSIGETYKYNHTFTYYVTNIPLVQ